MPFGLANAAPCFQRTMDDVVEKHNFIGAHPFLGDVIAGGRTEDELERNLKKFLDAVKADRLTLNYKKCFFELRTVAMLRHNIAAGSKRHDPDRFQTLENFPILEVQKALKRLIGFFACYSKWIQRFLDKIQLLLSASQHCAFPLPQSVVTRIKELKKKILNSPLSLPVRDKIPLIMETDASTSAIGCAITQAGRPIAFFSRSLSKSEKVYSSVEKEALVIVESFRN